jgi:hypothetical protein
MYRNIKTFETACEAEGVDPISALPYPMPDGHDQEAINAFAQLIIIHRAINRDESGQAFLPKWNNHNEKKFVSWFYMDAEGKAKGFGFLNAFNVGTFTRVGSHQVFRTRKRARHAATYFLPIYRAFMMFEK